MLTVVAESHWKQELELVKRQLVEVNWVVGLLQQIALEAPMDGFWSREESRQTAYPLREVMLWICNLCLLSNVRQGFRRPSNAGEGN
mmetsp:Transcript_143490/g.364199  ORF Transcript_143490/g.364199 Transcript_143490/m.364199 type:complete len:87 (+) Transcript_143490:411-671(+)